MEWQSAISSSGFRLTMDENLKASLMELGGQAAEFSRGVTTMRTRELFSKEGPAIENISLS